MAGELYDLYMLGDGEEAKRKALVDALRQRQAGQAQTADMAGAFGNLGMLTGDKVLGNFGQAQMGSANALRQLGQRQEGELADAGKMVAQTRLQKAIAAERRRQELFDTQSQRTYQEGRDVRQNAAEMGRARVLSGQKVAEQRRQATVPGMEISPDAEPTQDDAKKLKASLAAAARMGNYVKELRQLHHTKGTEYGGPVGTRMGQLSTAIKLEGKNIGELGAISGPDLALIEQIAGADPSSLGANAKALIGIDNTGVALDGLEKWVGDTVSGNAQALGYQPKAAHPKGGNFDLGGQDAAAMAWARANPGDPRAGKILQKLGAK